MSDSNSKIVLAVGVTAIVVAVVLIAGFLGFLYLRQPTAQVDGPGGPGRTQSDAPAPRTRGENQVAAADIAKVSYLYSAMWSRPATSPTAFSKIDSSNFSSFSRTLTFSSDGTATKVMSSESTVNGVKQAPGNESLTATVDVRDFAALTKILADNDFANEPDSRDITSLPMKKILTITYNGREKMIITGHLGRNSIETAAMLSAIEELEKKLSWQLAK